MWEFDRDELRSLISGNFQFRKCLDCSGNGWVWVDTELGEVVAAPMQTDDPDRYEKDGCETCSCLGGFLTIGGGNANWQR